MKFFSPWGEVKSLPGKIAVTVFAVGSLLVLSPVMLVGHKPLRWLGRNGFYFNETIHFGKASFKKRAVAT